MNEIITTRAELEQVLTDLAEAQTILENTDPYPDGPIFALATSRAIIENMLEGATD